MTKKTGRPPIKSEEDRKQSVSVSISARHLKRLKKDKTTPTDYVNSKLEADYPKPN